MSRKAHDFLKDLTATVLAGDYSVADVHFVFPFTIFVDNEVLVLANKQVLREGLADYARLLKENEITAITSRLIAPGLPKHGRFVVWIDWAHCAANGDVMGRNRVRYILHETLDPDKPMVELIDFSGPAFPFATNGLPTARLA